MSAAESSNDPGIAKAKTSMTLAINALGLVELKRVEASVLIEATEEVENVTTAVNRTRHIKVEFTDESLSLHDTPRGLDAEGIQGPLKLCLS